MIPPPKNIDKNNSNYFYGLLITMDWLLIYSFSPEKVGNIIQ